MSAAEGGAQVPEQPAIGALMDETVEHVETALCMVEVVIRSLEQQDACFPEQLTLQEALARCNRALNALQGIARLHRALNAAAPLQTLPAGDDDETGQDDDAGEGGEE